TAVEISGYTGADSNYFQPLVDATAENFAIGEVSADKAYLSHDNVARVEKHGGVPFVPFKTNTLVPKASDESAWARMYHRFAYDREAFLTHYHKRSNVETTFSMIKAKFGASLLSKTESGQVNEVL